MNEVVRIFLIVAITLGSIPLAPGKELDRAKVEFAVQDKLLNEIYQDLRKTLPADLFAKVREDQRRWIGYRDYISSAESKRLQKNPEDDPDYWTSAALMTVNRITWLKGWKGAGAPPSRGIPGKWDGIYRDSYGGELQIVERGGKLYFSLVVVRGPTFHSGACDGQAEVNGSMARFSVRYSPDEAPAWLTFLNNRQGDGRIEVIGENTGFFHGARAYFQGHYLRVQTLQPQDLEKLLKGSSEGGTTGE
ncbi:MAG: hypothetical protein CMN03_04040 [Roseibacillus sp.]|nr:hypothetical protein [Roseibacillus sp.]